MAFWHKRQEPRTYYARDHQSWGDKIDVFDWSQRKIVGWLDQLPRVGDVIVFDTKSGRELRTTITSVRYCNNPSDMFFATVKEQKS